MESQSHTYIAMDLKSFYASVECVDRGLDPLNTNLVVADASRTQKTICLAVSPSLKSYGIPGRARLFEVISKVREVNAMRKVRSPGGRFLGKSTFADELQRHPELEVGFVTATPRMARYLEYSTQIYNIYLKYIAPEDIHVYSIDEVFLDVTQYLKTYGMTARELASRIATEILEKKPDVDVVAAYQKQRHEGKFMAWCKDHFYRFINRLSEVDLRENASDFRTFRRNVQEALLDMPEYFRFSKGLFSWVGFETEYIPYVAAERFAGTTKWSFAKLIKYAMEGVISFSTMPLQLATFCGALVSVFAIVYGIIIIAHTLLTGIDVPGYATTIVVVLFLGGIQLLVMGILGEYLAKTYIQGKHRPVYVVKKVLEKKE